MLLETRLILPDAFASSERLKRYENCQTSAIGYTHRRLSSAGNNHVTPTNDCRVPLVLFITAVRRGNIGIMNFTVTDIDGGLSKRNYVGSFFTIKWLRRDKIDLPIWATCIQALQFTLSLFPQDIVLGTYFYRLGKSRGR